MASNKKIAVIGCGNMGAALVRGFCAHFVKTPTQIYVYDTDQKKTDALTSELGVQPADTIDNAVSGVAAVILAVKGDVMPEVLAEINELLSPRPEKPVLVSIAAGVHLNSLQPLVSKDFHVARVMPNVAATIGHGMSVIYSIHPEDSALIKELFESVGVAEVVSKEDHVDVATALTASGAAFYFEMIEAMADGGVKMGLSKDVALRLSVQTALGASMLASSTQEHPAKLRDQVTSPGGTTIMGLHELGKAGFRGGVISAVEASTERARQDMTKKGGE